MKRSTVAEPARGKGESQLTDQAFPNGATMIIGATGGLGAASARALARDGSDLALCFRSKRDAAEALADELRTLGRRVSLHALDVTDPVTIDAARDAAIAEHGRIHGLVWAAGPLVDQLHLSDTPLAKWTRAVSVEVHGFFAATQALIPHFRAQGGGAVLHLGSAGDLYWPPRDGLSVAPKAANESLVRGIAKEEGRHGIRANSVLVGVIDAGMFHDLLAQGQFDQAWVDEVQRQLPLRRWGRPEEIGDAVSFLMSNRAGYTTGQQLAVAGGYGV
jgi:NAD(P)-dependent dehydrogenase (short-subunit alcohol dehydrogenase family)